MKIVKQLTILVVLLCTIFEIVEVEAYNYALLFHNNKILKKNFEDFPSDEITFEAWISSTDNCYQNAICSYALDSKETDQDLRRRDFNHFVVFDTREVIACVDYPALIRDYDPFNQSCKSHYKESEFANLVSRDGTWHHLAVTWSKSNGVTKVYQDGLLMSNVTLHNSRPIQSGGAFMLGGEQDCYGGCTETYQGFYGLMDEVRLWNVVKTQSQIARNMRQTKLEDRNGLVAWWKFDDPSDNPDSIITQAKDYSGNDNHLDLKVLPISKSVKIYRQSIDDVLDTHSLEFANGYAVKPDVTNMPDKDVTVEFWAKTRALNSTSEVEEFAEFFSFASYKPNQGTVDDQWGPDLGFMDDAIVIEKYMSEFNGLTQYFQSDMDTKGSVSVHINANREGNGKLFDHWIDFKCDWLDDQWHHIAATWEWQSGDVKLYFDGEEKTPFWRSSAGEMTDETPENGGVERDIAARTTRSKNGSLVLGQQQETFGGGFSPFYAFSGEMSVLRVWDRVLDKDTINENMYTKRPNNDDGLIMMYDFDVSSSDNVVKDLIGSNDLTLGAPGAQFIVSTAPLVGSNNKPIPKPSPQSAGYAVRLNDMQVLSATNFDNFPSDKITVEFWMLSYDNCRKGVPFSYATGDYKKGDNSFLIFNYKNWGISVMEDEGDGYDHESGIGAVDGNWHHIAVTWQSSDGAVNFYQDGRKVWRVERAKGMTIPSGGALVIGREQDCINGCFDSAAGSVGEIETGDNSQYGAQDFFGYIDEIRIWDRVLDDDEVKQNMQADIDIFSADGKGMNTDFAVDIASPGLVAFYNFNEGQGYMVRDVTGNGHDLFASEAIDWVPIVWKSNCGNGIIEDTEMCDDGNNQPGDGCDENCQVEPFWTCVGEPSECSSFLLGPSSQSPSPSPSPSPRPSPSPYASRLVPPSSPSPAPISPFIASTDEQQEVYFYDSYDTPTVQAPQARLMGGGEQKISTEPSSDSSSNQDTHKRRGANVVVIVIVVIVIVAAVAVGLFVFRERIYTMFPGVFELFHGYRTPAGPIPTPGNVAIAPENKDIAAEFATASEYTPLKGENLGSSAP